MDILSHGLWGAALAKGINKTRAAAGAGAAADAVGDPSVRPVSARRAFFWGVFPDLFAFTIPFVWLIGSIATGGMSFSEWPRPESAEPPSADYAWVSALARALYGYSHSIVLFALVFGMAWFIRRRPAWELSPWFLHILMDIPTHTYRFYPTPFLWPLSDFRVNGFSWTAPWFMLANYGALALLYAVFLREKKRA